MKIIFGTNSASFIDENLQLETARILRKIANDIECGKHRNKEIVKIRDFNGNWIGNYQLNHK